MTTPPFKVKAIYDYTSPHDDDLNFPSGQIITVTEEEDAEWYIGEYTAEDGVKKDGLFPRNFVEKYEPQAPPRPTRSRPKQDTQTVPQSEPHPAVSAAKEDVDERTAPVPEPEDVVPTPQSPPSTQELPSAPKPQAAKPTPPTASKPAPPETTTKPSSSSFKDRIAAFNKPAAPPIAPKPSAAPGGSGFIKKPFVAPPPSKNAYVPTVPKAEAPQKVYRRDEDPEIAERRLQDQRAAEEAGLSNKAEPEAGEEAPQSTSLKDRIALLQKQQQEQAARRAETATKEKPRRPAKPRTESNDTPPGEDRAAADDVMSPEPRASADFPRPVPTRVRSHESEPDEGTRDVSDGNEADQSGAGDTTEDAEGDSTEVDEPAEKPRAAGRIPPPQRSTSGREPIAQTEEPEHGEEDEEPGDGEEEEMDPETRRREELRARMAKMSGGMGMPGMFGMPPPKAPPPTKKSSQGSERRQSQEARSPPPQQRVPMMPVPGMPPRVSSPPAAGDKTPSVEKESEPGMPVTEEQPPEAVPDVEDLGPHTSKESRPQESAPASRTSQERPLPAPPSMDTRAAPPIPGGRPLSQPESRAVPPPPPPTRASAANEDEEATPGLSPQRSNDSKSGRSMPQAPPPIPGLQSTLPRRDAPAQPPTALPPGSPQGGDRRSSRAPSLPPSLPQMPPPSTAERPPPPPPPSAVPPPRQPTSHELPSPPVDDGEDNESDYEGDYDTDIAPSAPHKDALRAKMAREPSLDDASTLSESTSARSPTMAPPPIPGMSRAVPPPPPQQAPPSRKSTDAPRGPPPMPPPHQEGDEDDDDYDPYRYDVPLPQASVLQRGKAPAETIQPSDLSLYEGSRQEAQQRAPPPIPPMGMPPQQKHAVPPPLPPEHRDPPLAPSRERESMEDPGRSLDPPRKSMTGRRSMDPGSRPIPDNGGQIARDVDLAESSLWWAQPNVPPPAFQNRNDVLYEMEESTASKRGGRSTTSKDIYILFQDYSQTVVTVRFDSKDPSRDVHLEQRHEPPPSRMRQDQLETAHTQLGEQIAAAAMTKHNQTVGDGTPQALVLDLLRNAPNALQPVGSRAYGALIYTNMSNATVSQHDEIRPGDIVTFRNARFKGKHGPMHAKYSMDVGKPEHVAVVAEWDGTKKKIRAWEQGREKEGKKVKMESFRVGDLGAGEVKVWRVVGRDFVGWDSNV